MVVILAVISAIPILNLFSLGYLLEASARVARGGKLRYGFVGMKEFARLGAIIISVWIWTLVPRFVLDLWQDAELIESGSGQADFLRFLFSLLCMLVVVHVFWAIVRGGKFRHFLWPAPYRFLQWLSRTGKVNRFREWFTSTRSRLQLLKYGKLGLGGFIGAALWLGPPIFLLIFAASVRNTGASLLLSLIGGTGLGLSVLFIPFLQTRFATTQRFKEFLSIRSVRRLFRRAPLAFWLALFFTLLFALPLYLLKIELTPREVAWLPNLAFVAFIFPARLLVGWAVSRAYRQETDRFWLSRWGARIAAIPVVAAYVLLVWLTQYLSWHGSLSLLEQHAFLVPAPLFGL